jgi:thioredoxin-like negative regulator of GroEL
METYNDYTDYSSEIGWNLAIAYLKDNNKKDASVVLEKLVAQAESGNAIHAKAIELLEKLK